MKIDPKQLKGGTLTGNITLTGSFTLPSLLSEATSLNFLALSSDNSIKKRTLGSMALLNATSFYDKITADSTFLKLTGGTLTGYLTVNADCVARGTNGIGALNSADINASVLLNFDSNIARIRVGGTGAGAMNGFSIQGPGNSSLLRILANTYVGIGTTNPTAQLDVVGSLVRFQGLGASSGMLSFGGSGSLGSEIVFNTQGATIQNNGGTNELLQYKASGSHVFWVNNVEVARFHSTGLNLASFRMTNADFWMSYAGRGAGGRALVHDSTNGLTINYANDFTGGVTIGSNVFFSNSKSYILNVNFGIGTATPSERLAVQGNLSLFGKLKLNASFGTTGQFVKNTGGDFSEWATITTSDISGLEAYTGLSNYLPLTGGELSGNLAIKKAASDTISAGPSIWLNGVTGTSHTYLQQGIGRFIVFGFAGSSWEEKMTIRHSDGYVGIGTPNPIYRLDVNGTARFMGNMYFGDYAIFANNKFIDWNDTLGNPRRLLGLASNGFHVGDVDNTIANSVTNLWAKVQHNFFVNGDLKVQLVNGWNYFKGHIQAYGVLNTQIRTDSNDGIAGKIQSVDGSSVYMGAESNHYLNFITNNVIRATIDTAGNFGIGTTTPSYLGLQVHKGSTSAGILLSNAGNNWSLYTDDSTNNAFIITDNQWGERFRISANGNIGLSTNVPNRKLTVYSNTADVYSSFRTASSLQEGMLFGLGTNNQGVIFNSENTPIEFYTNRALVSTLLANGNWGIGTANPLTKLHVFGYGQLNGVTLGSLNANECGTVLFTENYGNGVTHLYSLKHTIGYGDLALAEYGGRVGIGTDRPNETLDVRGVFRLSNNGFVSGTSGSFLNIWHANTTGNSYVNLQAYSNGGNTYDNLVLQLSGEALIGTLTGGYKLSVGGSVRIDGFLRLGENLAFNCNQFAFWKDSAGTDRRIVGMNETHSIYVGDIDRTISNSNLLLLANSTHWFICGYQVMATITTDGLDVKGNYYQNGVLKTFFSGNYNDLSNRPDLSGYLTWSNVETAWNGSNWNDTNNNPISVKLVKGLVDGKANASHTHDWSAITGKPTFFDGNYNNLTNRPNLSSYLTWSNVETAWNGSNWNDTNNNPISVKLVKGIADGKANSSHTHDWNSITSKPSFFDGNYNNLSNRPDLSSYLTQSNVVVDNANVTINNVSPIAAKLVYLYVNDLWSALNSKANSSHTHDWNSITSKPSFFDGNYNSLTNRPDLGSFLTWANVETGTFSTTGWNDSNTKATSVRFIKPLIDDLYGYISGLENSKSNVVHTHTWESITGKPTWDWSAFVSTILASGAYGNKLVIDSGISMQSGLRLPRLAGMSGYLAVNPQGDVIVVASGA